MDELNKNFVFYELKNNISNINSLLNEISNFNYDSFITLFSKKIFTLKAITSFYELRNLLDILIYIEKIIFKIRKLDYYEVWKIIEVFKMIFSRLYDEVEDERKVDVILKEYFLFFEDPYIFSSERINSGIVEPLFDASVQVKKFDIFQVYLFYLEFDEFVNNSEDIRGIRKRWNDFRRVFSNISFENMVEFKQRLKSLFARYNYLPDISVPDKKIIIMKSIIERYLEIINIIFYIISSKTMERKIQCTIEKNQRNFLEINIKFTEIEPDIKWIFSRLDFSNQEFDKELIRIIDQSDFSKYIQDFIRLRNLSKGPVFL